MSEEQATYSALSMDELTQAIAVFVGREIPRIDSLEKRVDALQDANLAPLLEASAVLVEIRRLADALEVLAEDVAYALRSQNR